MKVSMYPKSRDTKYCATELKLNSKEKIFDIGEIIATYFSCKKQVSALWDIRKVETHK